MFYTKSPFSPKSSTTKKPHWRINSRTISHIPVWETLIVRNGCPVRYEGGYLVPLHQYMFSSAQEVSDFLHTDGRKGLYRITRNCIWWEAIECVQVSTKKQALEMASKHWFRYVFSWKKNEDIYG